MWRYEQFICTVVTGTASSKTTTTQRSPAASQPKAAPQRSAPVNNHQGGAGGGDSAKVHALEAQVWTHLDNFNPNPYFPVFGSPF